MAKSEKLKENVELKENTGCKEDAKLKENTERKEDAKKTGKEKEGKAYEYRPDAGSTHL